MGRIRLYDNPDLPITVRRSRRSRRMSLRVSALDGRVTLTLPTSVSLAEGQRFIDEKAPWLIRQLQSQPTVVPVALGAEIPVDGVLRRVVPGHGRAILLGDDTLTVPGPSDRVAAKTQGWLKAYARDRLTEAADRYATQLGRPYDRVTLRDTRSRWGSCTADGGLMFSWRLAMAPRDILDYVAAHEVAHLAEMNHGPRFWKTVERLYGEWQPARDWLRQHGGALHRYRFGD